MRSTSVFVLCLLCLTSGSACDESEKHAPNASGGAPAHSQGDKGKKPERLYIPTDPENTVDLRTDQAAVSPDVTFSPGGSGVPPLLMRGNCPADMVDVAGKFCIDRYESSLVDAKTGQELSPFFPPSRRHTSLVFERFVLTQPETKRELGRLMPSPAPPEFQLREDFAPRSRSLSGLIPSGYLSRDLAETACENAGKRLCQREEWVEACRGQAATKFPYGNTYEPGTCNVHRNNHPARLLYGDASRNHMDPRLGMVEDEDGPLLRLTGNSELCVSRWGADAIYDMVGNLDEWIHEPTGSFLGGFYSRATTAGCDATIDLHDPGYLDYSLGTRCCTNPGN